VSDLLEQPTLVLREKISYAQFRITDEIGADLGLVRGSLRDFGEDFGLEEVGGERLASFRWSGEARLETTPATGLHVFTADERHVGTVVVKRGDVSIVDAAGDELARTEGSVRRQAQFFDAGGECVATVSKMSAGLWRSLNGESDYRIDFAGEPSDDLRLLIIAAPVAWDRKVTGGPRVPGD
jgi:hypothetical protein